MKSGYNELSVTCLADICTGFYNVAVHMHFRARMMSVSFGPRAVMSINLSILLQWIGLTCLADTCTSLYNVGIYTIHNAFRASMMSVSFRPRAMMSYKLSTQGWYDVYKLSIQG